MSCSKDNEQITVTASVFVFAPATGYYYPGNQVVSSISIKNAGNVRLKYWMSCTVKDKLGKWYDIPVDTISLNPGEVQDSINLVWIIPTSAPIISGAYTVRMAVWNNNPSDANSTRLDNIEAVDAFSAFNFLETFDKPDSNYWTVINKPTPGYGQFRPENIIINGGLLSILYPKNTKDGGELKSVTSKTNKYGTFRTKIKTPSQLPGTYSTLFLYNETTLDEIDIEIWNDGSKKVNLTTWVNEIQKYSKSAILNFDPSAQFHEYRIDYYPDEISFWIDNIKAGSTNILSEIPKSDMFIYINGWWPKWMTSAPAVIDKYAVYDWIQY